MEKAVQPIHYNLSILFDFKTRTYTGSVEILVSVLEKTNVIHLDASRSSLQVASQCNVIQNKQKISVQTNITETLPTKPTKQPTKFIKSQKSKNKKSKSALNNEVNQEILEDDKLIVTCKIPLSIGKATLMFGFKGQFRNDLRGIYLCKNNVLCTHFEPSYARTAFPCFDAVDQKATFSLQLEGIPPEMSVVSNMPVKNDSMMKNVRRVSFEKTPIMSPYLLSFAIGKFFVLEKSTRIPIRVLSTSNQIQQLEFILNVVHKSLEFMESEFGSEYNLPKLDTVIVPEHSIGGMENWGCIFLNESATLITNKDKKQEKLVELIAHEVAHQWLGNLISLPFWVKEGLAQYYELKFADAFFNRNLLAQQKAQNLLEMEQTSKNIKEEFSKKFNGVTYQKSLSSILNIINILGEKEFSVRLKGLINDEAYNFVSESNFVRIFTP